MSLCAQMDESLGAVVGCLGDETLHTKAISFNITIGRVILATHFQFFSVELTEGE